MKSDNQEQRKQPPVQEQSLADQTKDPGIRQLSPTRQRNA